MATKHMHRFVGGVLLAAASTATSAAPAHADKVTSVGAFGGWHVFSKRNELGVPDTSGVEVDAVKSGLIVGARFGILFTNWVGVEAEAGFIPTGSRLNDDVSASAVAYRAHLFV